MVFNSHFKILGNFLEFFDEAEGRGQFSLHFVQKEVRRYFSKKLDAKRMHQLAAGAAGPVYEQLIHSLVAERRQIQILTNHRGLSKKQTPLMASQ